MSRSFVFLSVVLLGLLIGCEQSTKPAAQSSSNSPANSNKSSTPVTSNSEKSVDAKNNDSQQGVPEKAIAAPTPAPSSSAKAPAATDQKPTAGTTPAPVEEDPILEGVTDPRIRNAHQQIKTRLAANPKDLDARLTKINLYQIIGVGHAQSGKREKGNALLKESAQMVREIMTDGSQIPEKAKPLISQTFYNEACALEDDGKLDDALKSLDSAFAQGFADLNLLSTDEDLAAIRNHPDFPARLEKWKEAAKDAAPPQTKKE